MKKLKERFRFGNVLKVSFVLMLAISFITVNKINAADEDTWGPQDRPFYTVEVPAADQVFNSITNNPELGDERNFVRVREAGTNDTYTDEVHVKAGKEYEVYVYFHNNAAPNLLDTDPAHSIATNVRLKMESPEKVVKDYAAQVKGTISWTKGSDTTIYKVWDSTFLIADETVWLRYVPHSTKLFNEVYPEGLDMDSENPDNLAENEERGIFTEWGSPLVYDKDIEWGMIPGCNEYAGYVTFRLVADQPKFYTEKEVSLNGETDWTDEINAVPGDVMHFRIRYSNVGTVRQDAINVSDSLPEGFVFEKLAEPKSEIQNFKVKILKYVDGEIVHNTHDNDDPSDDDIYYINADDFFNGDGVVIGNFEPNEVFEIYYDVKIAAAETFADCSTNIWNKATVRTENGTQFDKVRVTITNDKDDCKKLPETGSNNNTTVIIVSSIAFGFVAFVGAEIVAKRANGRR